MCCQNWHLFCHRWLDFRFPWFKLCPQLRLCKYHGSFLRDTYSLLYCAFPRLMTCTIKCHFSIIISLLIWRNPYIDSKNSVFYTDSYIWMTIQCSTRIRFWSPLCLRHGLKNCPMINPLLYINIVHILQTDKPTYTWFFFHSKLNFAKLSNLMPCINKLYLSIHGPTSTKAV